MLEKLTPARVKALVAGPPGRFGDGGNLWLCVRGAGRVQWTLRYMRDGAAREMGLGPYPDVGLAEARKSARQARQMLRDGTDPIDAGKEKRAKARGTVTFRKMAEQYIESHRAGWRNVKHAEQWATTLETYAYPVIGDLSVAAIDAGHITRILEPIWKVKVETASRVRGRIEAVLDAAAARGWRHGDNPARWRGHLQSLLPARTRVQRVQHHAALPWRDIGAFMVALHEQAGVGALALQFAILTAARSGEVRGARWAEIDMAAKVWTVPAERMKAGREHRIPLSDDALDVLRRAEPLRDAVDGDLVFPGAKRGAPLSDMSLTAVLRRMGRGDLTAHGFRSTFRDWAGETTAFPREVIERALAHRLGDKVEEAYARGDLFEKRGRLMADWAVFCARPAPAADNVRPMRRAEAG